MRLSKIGLNKTANVILGAGASRGASCFKSAWAQSPLDTDFFDQLDRLKNLPEGRCLTELAEFARDEFGASNELPMEAFYTQLESLNEFYETLKIDRGPRVRAYRTQLDRFPTYLAAVFRSLRSICPSGGLDCDFHHLLAKTLHTGDSVISFNYDCLMDEALHAEARKSWDARVGYGTSATTGAQEWHDHSGKGRVSRNSIKLLKVHGSLNWVRNPDGSSIGRSSPIFS